MLIENIKSGHQQIVDPEKWNEMLKKPLVSDPSKSFASAYKIVDKEASTMPVKNGTIPAELKVIKASDKKVEEKQKK